ncbi:MAG TPA: PQQ-binding-like beta-propeller repeat protein [Gemmataceae bacterium]|jgi:outer membrane protein assembly factor BamB|nr:PQQ-binding-like beta-propeller repeat protein [Gemmataceae bacterium]
MRSTFTLFVAASFVATAGAVRADDWPQWLGPKRDSVWRETGLIEKFPPGGPPVVWRKPIAHGFAGPAVADGRVFVIDYESQGDQTPIPGVRKKLTGKERVLCFDARTGQDKWKYEYACDYSVSYQGGPRCTPTVGGDKVYTLGTMGHLACVDVATGRPVWTKELTNEYKTETPMWGFAGHPLVDGKKLVCLVGGDGSVVVAFDKDTGKELWKALSAKEPGYAAPSIVDGGGIRQLIVFSAESVNGLDPETGKVYWTIEMEPYGGMSIQAPRNSGDYLFASAVGNKSALLKLAHDKPAVTVVWPADPKQGSDAKKSVYPVNAPPFVDDGVIYGNDGSGAFMAVDLMTGDRLWETFEPTGRKKGDNNATVFQVKNGDRFVMFNEAGELILAKLDRQGYHEISRAKIIEPTGKTWKDRPIVWSHPAFAHKCVYARNDKEIVCVSLAAGK